MELLATIIVVGGLLTIAGLLIFFCWKASRMMQEEAARAELRRQTRNAMLTDRHMQRLRRNKMRAQYVRRARVW